MDWVPFFVQKNQKDVIEGELGFGASVDEFFECFDQMRSSQSTLSSSGMWNLTCSVFSAITAASSLCFWISAYSICSTESSKMMQCHAGCLFALMASSFAAGVSANGSKVYVHNLFIEDNLVSPLGKMNDTPLSSSRGNSAIGNTTHDSEKLQPKPDVFEGVCGASCGRARRIFKMSIHLT
jgi:hypothetical protein